MGFRFRKSINCGPLRLNISKSGIGGSIGVKGCRLTKTANGKTRSTVSIPGTGISYVSEHGKAKTAESCDSYKPVKRQTVMNWFYYLCLVFWLPMILAGLTYLLVDWIGGLLGVAIGLGEFIYVHKKRKKAKENAL